MSFVTGVVIVAAVLLAIGLAARHGWSRRDRRKRLAYLLLKLSSLDEEGARNLFGDVSCFFVFGLRVHAFFPFFGSALELSVSWVFPCAY